MRSADAVVALPASVTERAVDGEKCAGKSFFRADDLFCPQRDSSDTAQSGPAVYAQVLRTWERAFTGCLFECDSDGADEKGSQNVCLSKRAGS